MAVLKSRYETTADQVQMAMMTMTVVPTSNIPMVAMLVSWRMMVWVLPPPYSSSLEQGYH